MLDRDEHHIAAGWNDDHDMRWIEAGRLRVEEDDKGAKLVVQDRRNDCWLSATELAGLTRHLAGWFAEDPTTTIRDIESYATRVKDALEVWNDRARADEEHPPYDDLTRTLDALLARCRSLRDDLGKFTDKPGKDKPVITVKEG